MENVNDKDTHQENDKSSEPHNEDSCSPLREATDNLIANDVKFNNDVTHKDPLPSKKRRRHGDQELTEEEEKELHEQRYKRLIHLLNRSQFYATYLMNKVDNIEKNTEEKKENNDSSTILNSAKKNKDSGISVNAAKKSKHKKEKESYDITKYISVEERKKLVKNKTKLNLSIEEIKKELSNDVMSPQDLSNSTELPKYFVGSLRNYQVEGLHWLKILYENGVNGILADEMGLGKTIQIIALICHLIEKHQSGPFLIVAPLSTLPNWTIEFKKFAPLLPVVVFHGKEEIRRSLHKQITAKHNVDEHCKTQPIVLTSFEIPLVERKFLITQKWRYIIVDEGHRLKNHNCLLLSVLKSLTSLNRLLLTGTPLQNNLSELWSLLNFLLPEIFNDLAVFEAWFNANEVQHDEGAEKFLKQEEEKRIICLLREILKPFMLRREKADVCLEIPPKKEVVVYAPLTQLQHDLYTAVLNRDIDILRKIKDENTLIYDVDGRRPKRKCFLRSKYGNTGNHSEAPLSPVSSITKDTNSLGSETWKNINEKEERSLNIWKQYTEVTQRNLYYFVKLTMNNPYSMYKKIVNHPYLIHCPLDSDGLPQIDSNLIKSSGKLLVLDAMLAKLKSQGHKVLLFSTMTMLLDIIEDYLSMRSYKYTRLDGRMKIYDRSESITSFNTDPDVFLFLISTKAGGVGLNLTGADTVIIYDSDWNPQVDLQAMARCHRIGQTRPVVIYRLCTKGTIDEKIISRASAKRILEKMVISSELRNTLTLKRGTLLDMKKLLDSKEYKVVKPNKAVFTEAELEQLLDRSDILGPKTSD